MTPQLGSIQQLRPCHICGKRVRIEAYQTIDGNKIVVVHPDCKQPKFIDTTWELRSYDVWGNSRDGYEVNDSYRIGTVTIRCKVKVNNAGTPYEFLSASPSDSQIRKAFGLRRFKLETDGDDLTIYVNRAKDGYPCGEMFCTSHESLSPIRVSTSTKNEGRE